MKKFLPYVVVLVVLGGVAGWFAWKQTSGTALLPEDAFAVKDIAQVEKITMADTDNKRVELTKLNGVWMVNGKFTAREELLQNLFEVVTRITVLSPVAKAAHDNVLREMLARSVKVDIYGKDNELLKSYYVGGPTVTGEATYTLLILDGKVMDRPYVTYLPGLKGYVTYRFSTDEENWRSKILFRHNVQNIQSLSVEYTADEKNSFLIKRVEGDSFSLNPLDEKYRMNETYQQKYIRQYLNFYSELSFEAFDNDYSKKDSILNTRPYCIITVTDKQNEVTKVNLFHMPLSKRSKTQFDEKGEEMTYDIDHYHAGINRNTDLVITQYYVLGKVLRSYKDFFFKPSASIPPVSK